MDGTKTDKIGLFHTRNSAKNPFLFRIGQLGLEADHVVHAALPVFRPQLDNGIRYPPGLGMGQADRLHGAKTQGVTAALDHDLDG